MINNEKLSKFIENDIKKNEKIYLDFEKYDKGEYHIKKESEIKIKNELRKLKPRTK